MRRGELAGLRWVDIDFDHATVSPTIPRVVVDHQVHNSSPKTEWSRRRLALDPVTLAALQAQRDLQAEDHKAVGSRYRDHGYVFAWSDGRPLHPKRSPTGSNSTRGPPGYRGSACMTCATATPPQPSRPGSRPK